MAIENQLTINLNNHCNALNDNSMHGLAQQQSTVITSADIVTEKVTSIFPTEELGWKYEMNLRESQEQGCVHAAGHNMCAR